MCLDRRVVAKELELEQIRQQRNEKEEIEDVGASGRPTTG